MTSQKINRRVVITGMGIVSPLGEGITAFWNSLEAGRCALGPLESISGQNGTYFYGSEIKDFNAKQHIDIKQRKQLKVMSRDIQLAVVASKFAMEDLKMDLDDLNPERIGISFGSSLINNELGELGPAFDSSSRENKINLERVGTDALGALQPLWMLKYLPNMPACHISINYDLRGPSNSITTEGAASLQAIGEGMRVVERGDADIMLAGGVDSKVNPVALSKYELLGILAKGSKESPPIYQPFSESTNFLAPSEAAGVLILEEYEHAKRRGAHIYGELKGYGSAPLYDFLPQESNDVEGRFISMTKALSDSGFSANDIDFVVAGGLGVQKADTCESAAFKKLFTENQDVLYTCLKSQLGYTASAAGAVDVIAAALMMKKRKIPHPAPCSNFKNDFRLIQEDVVLSSKSSLKALINATGLVGQAASLVIANE